MPDLTVPVVLFALVMLILLGQWLVVRRAKSMRGQVVPDALWQACEQSLAADDSAHRLDFLSDKNVLVSFDSPNCGACRKMAPTLAAIGERYPGRACNLSVTEHRSLAQSLRIMGTPTMLLIQDGRIINVFVGITPKSRLIRSLQEAWPRISPDGESDVQDPSE